MRSLFALMLAGYALGAAAAVLRPGGRGGRGLVAAGAVLGGGAGLALGLGVLLTGAAYSEGYEGRASLRLLGAPLNLSLLTMSLVPCAGNGLTSLFRWEGMSLT